MKQALFVSAVLVLATQGCSLHGSSQATARAPQAVHADASAKQEADAKPTRIARKVGDFAVQRFSGSYQSSPLTLTEEVVAQEGELWVIDYTLEDAARSQKLRVRLDPKTDSVVRVSQLTDAGEQPSTLDAYDKLMERTSFAADVNDGLLKSEHGTCLVGMSELACETKSYKVWVGDKEATLNVSHSEGVSGRDVAGDITASDGTLLYRAELLEVGSADAPKGDVASR
ncbi:MAG TPA: hypothetical protein VGM29_10665 [Polyangiaceae bacterium]